MNSDGRREGHAPQGLVTGFKLLDKFTAMWEQLHCASDANIEKSQLVMDKLNSIDKKCKTHLSTMESFASSYKSLSNLENQISSISCDISNLENTLIKIEECLSLLALRKDLSACELHIRRCKGDYEAQVQKENIQMELRRDQLMSEHLLRVCEFERKQQEALDERRKLLTNEFEAEKASHLRRQ